MLKEEQGEEYLDFVYTTLVTSDCKIILEKAKPLITEEQYLEIKTNISLIETEIYDNNQFVSKSGSNEKSDKYLHFMAGAVAASLTACLVYLFASWWTPWVKVGAILALGVSVALLAGAAKEYYDSKGKGDCELEDFIVTGIGGYISSGLCTILGALNAALT